MMKHLFHPIDAAILIYLRFFAGIFLSLELINSLFLGDFGEYLAPFHFSYLYLEWIKPWSFWEMVFLYGLTILSGFTFAFGIRQRLSALILFCGYLLLFLMEKSEYVNHLYLYCLISFWLIFMPVIKNGRATLPAWYHYLMLFHISIVYFYAGIAKLDSEWLSGSTVKVMLDDQFSYLYTYGGLFFDLLIVPFLLWKRTRKYAFFMACLFHLTNVFNFGLATFPWFSIVLTSLFFGSQWPRRFTWFDDFFPENNNKGLAITPIKQRVITFFLIIYCLGHIAIPLRHHLYPGRVSWTEDGHLFSWRMKLRTKSGKVVFYVQDKPSNQLRVVFPQQYLTPKQYKDMIGKPDSILQFAHFLSRKNGGSPVFASARISLNGKPEKEMINKFVDLSKEERKITSYSWVLNEVSENLADK